MTREHIFRSSWRKKLDVSRGLKDMPVLETGRRLTKYGLDNSEKQSRLEDLFSVTVKRVCAPCNNGWMNDLDSVVEPWVFDPNDDGNRCDPTTFRRWAIKVALLRSYYEHPHTVEPSDPAKIYNGDDIPEWHIFVGRTASPEHRHTFGGIDPVLSVNGKVSGGKLFGITQVSWTLGHSLVIAIRLVGNHVLPRNGLKNFKRYNRLRGVEVLEVLPGSTVMPRVSSLPALQGLLEDEADPLFLFFTPNPKSPIADEVREANEMLFEIAKRAGYQTHEV
jgi:hypothetical protein